MDTGIDSGITNGATIVSTCDTTSNELGFIPGPLGMVADLTNAGIHLARGNYGEAAFSLVGAVPIVGDALAGGRMAVKGADAISAVNKGTSGASGAAKLGGDAAKAGQKGAKESIEGCGKIVNGKPACFTEGTQIVVGAIYDEDDVFVEYVTVNIEDIQVGDLVYSYDTITGTTEQKAVTAVFVRESDHINYLTIIDEYGREQVIETTDGHPFWVVTDEPDLERAAREVVDENGVILYHENIAPGLNGFWVEAKDLRAGDVFLGANGELSTLVAAERVVFPDGIKVYNFTVEGNHNYFVIAKDDPFGQTCILVHNANYTIVSKTTTNKGHQKIDYLFGNRNDAMNWAANSLGQNKTRIYDEKGKWIGWKNDSGDIVNWGHGDWYKRLGSSTFPHLNYEIGNTKGHLFLADKIGNAGLMGEFRKYFGLK